MSKTIIKWILQSFGNATAGTPEYRVIDLTPQRSLVKPNKNINMT